MRRSLQVVLLLSLILVFPAAAALAQDSITLGDTVEGQLTSASVEYTFEGESGQTVNITLVSEDFDAYLRLNDADGSEIASNDDAAGNLNARIGPYKLPANGEYTIVVTTFAGSGTGAFSLTLETVDINVIEYSQSVEGELTATNTSLTYYFTGQSGDSVTIALSSDDFDAYLRFGSADDPSYDLATNDDSSGSRNSFIGPYVLPNTGEYIITATSLDGVSTGSFTLTLNKADVTVIELGDTVEAELKEGAPLLFTFEGVSGQVIDIRVDSGDTIDTRLVLRTPSAYDQASDDDSGGRYDPEIRSAILSENGTYTILVQPYSTLDVGQISLTVAESKLPTLNEGPARVRLSDKQTQQVLVYTGKAGETVRLKLTVENDAVLSPSIDVRQADVSVAYASTTSVNAFSMDFTIPADGVLTITLSDYSYQTSIVNVAIERPEAE